MGEAPDESWYRGLQIACLPPGPGPRSAFSKGPICRRSCNRRLRRSEEAAAGAAYAEWPDEAERVQDRLLVGQSAREPAGGPTLVVFRLPLFRPSHLP